MPFRFCFRARTRVILPESASTSWYLEKNIRVSKRSVGELSRSIAEDPAKLLIGITGRSGVLTAQGGLTPIYCRLTAGGDW